VAAAPVAVHDSVQHTANALRPAAESAAALQARLHADCADGTIDGVFPRGALLSALSRSDQSAEYGDCHRALLQATT
jgi:hypothetical protein